MSVRIAPRFLFAAVISLAGIGVFAGCGRSVEIDPQIAATLPDRVDYNFHVKPVLSDRCYACHGPDLRALKAKLRLDTEEGALKKKLESGGHAIVAGSPARSKVVDRILSDDPEYQMPPPESNLVLSDYEKALIVKWIDQGAEWKPHWAFLPVSHDAPPAAEPVEADAADASESRRAIPAGWPANGIDSFVLDRLAHEGLVPSPEADRERLLRRVTFNLTGLPPTIEELDNFLADDSPDAYERAVDRLLASPAYGEHMAAEWLDIARYADSHGYQDDGLRNMWPWRDWVISAFNRNLPYDEFITVQLAGDLLPDHTRDQVLATGFNRNHLQSQEGGIVPEEYRVDYVADRTNTLGRAMLGMTVECARCHDHKFDPLSQKEYYQLFAFFNSVKEFGNIPYAGEASPTVILTTPAVDDSIADLQRRIDAILPLLDVANAEYDAGFLRWKEAAGAAAVAIEPAGRIAYYPMDAVTERALQNLDSPAEPARLSGDPDKSTLTVPAHKGSGQKLVGDTYVDMGLDIGTFERNDPFSISLWMSIDDDSTEGPLFSRSTGLFDGNRGYIAMLNADGTLTASLNHVFPANSIEIQTVDPLPRNVFQHLTMTYDGSSRAVGLKLYIDGKPLSTRTNADNLKMSTLYQVDPRNGKRSNWGGKHRLRLGWIEPNTAKLDSVVVDEFMVFGRELTPYEVGLLAETAGEPTSDDLRAWYVTTQDRTYRDALSHVTKLRGEQNEILTRQQETMVLEELDAPRPTYFLDRGAYDAPRDQVQPNVPEWMLTFDESLPRNRLGLAEWLTDPKHPLTSRVAVNRMWQRFFGSGIVATTGDFGNQGARPTHPELLDWLASQFVESGWDVKALQKLIVMSATYRQSSVADADLRERDPDNHLYARGPAGRLTAEEIRDNALAASGLLVRKIGGPSVKPYQPAGLWKELATRNATVYVQDHGDKLYRRSLYTIWKRTTPPPSMVSFDAADRNVCTVKRQSTNTPLQALVLLNDPQYTEASRALAEQVLRVVTKDDAGKIERAFRLLTSRRPTAAERNALTRLLDEQRQDFRADPRAAGQLLAVGESSRDTMLPITEVAAMTVVANTIMSFDDAVMLR